MLNEFIGYSFKLYKRISSTYYQLVNSNKMSIGIGIMAGDQTFHN